MKARRQLAWVVCAALGLSACASPYPAADPSASQSIDRAMSAAIHTPGPASAPSVVPAPPATALPLAVSQALSSATLGALLPESARGSVAQRFDLAVNAIPMGEVLAGLVEGSNYSMVIKPMTEGEGQAVEPKVTLNLKNVTVLEALDAIRDAYGYDYSVSGQRIFVQPAGLQTRLYQVNYVAGLRQGVSDLQVIGGASANNGGAASGYGSMQASGLSTAVKADFWSETEDAVRTALGCAIPKLNQGGSGSATTTSSASTTNKTNRSPGTQGAAALAIAGATERMRGVEGCPNGRAMVVNAMTGVIVVRGMSAELQMVERVLNSMQLSVSRQVIIEAKIIDVELNKSSQQGINWALFNQGRHKLSLGADAGAIGTNVARVSGGAIDAGTSLNALLGTNRLPLNGALNPGGVAFQIANFAALINFLETQGRVHMLSSPRISTLNNQKAVIKVGSEEPFVTNIEGGTTSVTNGTATVVTPPSLMYQPFFSGIDLDVTPQIDPAGQITLHVHTMVNRVVEKEKAALPGTSTTVPFAVNSMNETDSVVKAGDGQVVVIGGLMSERSDQARSGVPGAKDVPVAGGLFRWGEQTTSKRELVILLKPTVVKDQSAWNQALTDSQARMQPLLAPR